MLHQVVHGYTVYLNTQLEILALHWKRDQEIRSYHLFEHLDQKNVCKLGEWSLNHTKKEFYLRQ